jgi:flagellin-like protein|tara:strand:+ start:8949 stop:9425 length:477 start_codon:yes stop_codon:yes gene_type:complete
MINPLNKIKNKKGVSPVIATVLLIGIVIVIALIIFLWLRGLTQEAVIKFDQNVELVCDEIEFDADYSVGSLTISNIGNIPIYEMKIKSLEDTSFETQDLNTLSVNWPDAGLNPGRVFSDSISTTANSMILIPVLIGSAESGEKPFTCDESRHGKEIFT